MIIVEKPFRCWRCLPALTRYSDYVAIGLRQNAFILRQPRNQGAATYRIGRNRLRFGQRTGMLFKALNAEQFCPDWFIGGYRTRVAHLEAAAIAETHGLAPRMV